MKTPEFLSGLLIALVASGLTLGFHQVLAAPEEPRTESVVPHSEGRDAEILEAIARLEAMVSDLRLQRVEGSGQAVEALETNRVPIELSGTSNEIQQILERLEAMERRLSVSAPVLRDLEPLDRLRSMDVEAIRSAIQLRTVDRQALERDLHMRTMYEIVERFGYPTETGPGGSNSEMYWQYDLPSSNPENPNYFSLYFTGGLVTYTKSRGTD